jgi:hypothetical protein
MSTPRFTAEELDRLRQLAAEWGKIVSKRAFVADGSAYNWTIHRGYFGTFEPVVDFLHAVCTDGRGYQRRAVWSSRWWARSTRG